MALARPVKPDQPISTVGAPDCPDGSRALGVSARSQQLHMGGLRGVTPPRNRSPLATG